MKKGKKKHTSKILVATIMLIAVCAYVVGPILNVFADEYSFVVTFSLDGDHSMEADGNHLIIDEQYVEIRNDNNEMIDGTSVECNGEGQNKVCSIIVNNSTSKGYLNYNGMNQFTIYDGYTVLMGDTVFEDGTYNLTVGDAYDEYSELSFEGSVGLETIDGNDYTVFYPDENELSVHGTGLKIRLVTYFDEHNEERTRSLIVGLGDITIEPTPNAEENYIARMEVWHEGNMEALNQNGSYTKTLVRKSIGHGENYDVRVEFQNHAEIDMGSVTNAVKTNDGIEFTYENGLVTVTGNNLDFTSYEYEGPNNQMLTRYILMISNTSVTFSVTPNVHHIPYVVINGNRSEVLDNTVTINNLNYFQNNNSVNFEFSQDNEHINDYDGPWTINFGSGSFTVFANTDWEETATTELKGAQTLSKDDIIKINNFNPMRMEALLQTEHSADFRLQVNELGETTLEGVRVDDTFDFVIVKKTAPAPEREIERDPNAHREDATVTVTSSDEDYLRYECKMDEHGVETCDIERHYNLYKSYQNARISIGAEEVRIDAMRDEETGELPPSVTTQHSYDYNENANGGKVPITFSTLFVDQYVGVITVNNEEFTVADYIDYNNRTSWLNANHGSQELSFTVYATKSDVYNIEVNVIPMEGKNMYIGNFLWSGDIEEQGRDTYIGNAHLDIVKVVYELDDEVITVYKNQLENDPYIDYSNYYDYLGYDVGSLVVPEGAQVTMKITPDYGYQVMNVGLNENAFIAEQNVSEFTFPIHKGNFHIGAEVRKVDDEVVSNTEDIQNGTIELGGREIESGTIVLAVSDANLNDNEKDAFTVEGYSITSYLDIELNQVLYKGTKDNVWSHNLTDLNNDATITLTLKDGVNGNDIILVHQKHNGTFETINAIYNSETNTITFNTDEFSNYAIAYRESEVTKYTVTFDSNGGPNAGNVIVNEGDLVNEPNIEREGFRLIGWFIGDDQFDFNTPITANITLIARWEEDNHEDDNNDHNDDDNNHDDENDDNNEEVNEDDKKNQENLEKSVLEIIQKIDDDETPDEMSEEMVNAIKDAIAQDKDLSVEYEVDGLEESSIDGTIKDKIESALKTSKSLAYFDVSIALKVDDVKIGNITKLDTPTEITFDISEVVDTLEEVKKGYERVFKVFREHNGVVESLNVKYSNKKITFASDKFSTYVLAYEDVLKSTIPKTGDEILTYVIMFGVSIISLASIILIVKKQS